MIMVRFEDEKLVIEIVTHTPAEDWLNIHTGICDVIRNVDSDLICNDSFYSVIDFMNSLVPDWEDAKRMQK